MYQNTFCLTGHYRRCPVFAEKNIRKLPPEAAAFPPTNKRLRLIAFWTLIAVTAVLLFGISGVWDWFQGAIRQAPGEDQLRTAAAQPPPGPSVTAIISPIPYTLIPTGQTPAARSPTISPGSLTATHTAVVVIESETYTPPACQQPPGWTLYTIQPGDTLFSLALSYGLTVEDFQEANCMADTYIWAGRVLYVPGYETITLSPSLTAAPSTTPTGTATPSATVRGPDLTP